MEAQATNMLLHAYKNKAGVIRSDTVGDTETLVNESGTVFVNESGQEFVVVRAVVTEHVIMFAGGTSMLLHGEKQ